LAAWEVWYDVDPYGPSNTQTHDQLKTNRLNISLSLSLEYIYVLCNFEHESLSLSLSLSLYCLYIWICINNHPWLIWKDRLFGDTRPYIRHHSSEPSLPVALALVTAVMSRRRKLQLSTCHRRQLFGWLGRLSWMSTMSTFLTNVWLMDD
jgi:hypothetical protein